MKTRKHRVKIRVLGNCSSFLCCAQSVVTGEPAADGKWEVNTAGQRILYSLARGKLTWGYSQLPHTAAVQQEQHRTCSG